MTWCLSLARWPWGAWRWLGWWRGSSGGVVGAEQRRREEAVWGARAARLLSPAARRRLRPRWLPALCLPSSGVWEWGARAARLLSPAARRRLVPGGCPTAVFRPLESGNGERGRLACCLRRLAGDSVPGGCPTAVFRPLESGNGERGRLPVPPACGRQVPPAVRRVLAANFRTGEPHRGGWSPTERRRRGRRRVRPGRARSHLCPPSSALCPLPAPGVSFCSRPRQKN